MVVIIPSYFGIGFFLGRYAAFLFVAIYAAATIIIDVAPDRFLRAMPGGEEDADPLPGTVNPPAPHDAKHRRHKNR